MFVLARYNTPAGREKEPEAPILSWLTVALRLSSPERSSVARIAPAAGQPKTNRPIIITSTRTIPGDDRRGGGLNDEQPQVQAGHSAQCLQGFFHSFLVWLVG